MLAGIGAELNPPGDLEDVEKLLNEEEKPVAVDCQATIGPFEGYTPLGAAAAKVRVPACFVEIVK